MLDFVVIEIWPICRELEILFDDVYWSHDMYTWRCIILYLLRLLRIIYACYHFVICWWRDDYFLNKCFIRVAFVICYLWLLCLYFKCSHICVYILNVRIFVWYDSINFYLFTRVVLLTPWRTLLYNSYPIIIVVVILSNCILFNKFFCSVVLSVHRTGYTLVINH